MGMLPTKKAYLVKKSVKELAPSFWDLLNGQGVQRTSCLQKLDIRIEGAMVKVFVEAVQKCVRVKKEKYGCTLSARSKVEETRCSICLCRR